MVALILVFLVTLFRILPHPANFAPMGAVAILSGRTMSVRMALLTTLVAMVVSDAALSFQHGYTWFGADSLFVYSAFLLEALLGRSLRQRTGGGWIAPFLGACTFFAVSNFGVWLQGGLYPRTLEGFLSCYVMALPFFKMTLLGNMIWTPFLIMLDRRYRARLATIFRVPLARRPGES